MSLPSSLLQAAGSPGGGKIALVLGAGCSVEHPTGIPVAGKCSLVVHDQLLADRVLEQGDCKRPDDLSLLSDAVFAKTGTQRPVVERLTDTYNLKLASPNLGYQLSAALLAEGILIGIVTFNFDLAMSHALATLGVTNVGVIESPSDMPKQKQFNVYYLHGNANAHDPETWVLRSGSISEGWRNHWEPIITTRILSAPNVVCVGLGTPISVLIETVQLIRTALPETTSMYQVDVGEFAHAGITKMLGVEEFSYIRAEWGSFMRDLSVRVALAQIAQIKLAVAAIVAELSMSMEETAPLTDRLLGMGLMGLGHLRANWLLHDKAYYSAQADSDRLLADLLLGLSMIARLTGTHVLIAEDSIVEFQRDGRTVAAFFVASGKGHRGLAAVEAELTRRRRQTAARLYPPGGAIVAGTSDSWLGTPSPPPDIVGEVAPGDLVAGPGSDFTISHIGALRQDPDLALSLLS